MHAVFNIVLFTLVPIFSLLVIFHSWHFSVMLVFKYLIPILYVMKMCLEYSKLTSVKYLFKYVPVSLSNLINLMITFANVFCVHFCTLRDSSYRHLAI